MLCPTICQRSYLLPAQVSSNLLSLIFVLSLLALPPTVNTQTNTSSRQAASISSLELAKPIEREITGGEVHADETFNRMARKIADGEEIQKPAGYVMGVARLLVLEIIKSLSRQREALGEYQHSYSEMADVPESESRIECLQKCLQQLSPDNREFIIQYYQGDKREKIENRRKLGERLGVAINTLRMRAQRLRERLQGCVEECVNAG